MPTIKINLELDVSPEEVVKFLQMIANVSEGKGGVPNTGENSKMKTSETVNYKVSQ